MKLKSILVSQPVPAILEKSPFYELIEKYKCRVDFYPFIKVEGVSLKDFRSQRVEILKHQAVILTSRTTVDHFFRICEQARINVPETMKYLCSSEAVAFYLQKYIVYRKRKISFANGSFTNLMELIVKHKNEKLLLILSEPHKPELPDTLKKLNLDFSELILSRTVSNDLSQIDIRNYDVLVFYSPSEITAMKSAFDTSFTPYIAAFGESTARAIVDAGLKLYAMAPIPEIPSMTKALDIFISGVERGKPVKHIELYENRFLDEFIKSHEVKPAKKIKNTEIAK